MRRAKHRFWNSHLAATHLVFFIISAAIFIPVVIGLFLYTQDLADTQNDDTAGLSSRASAALVQMTSNPGLNAAKTSTRWEQDAMISGVAQVGLRDETSMSLGYAKIDNLQRAGVPANAADGFLNYEEMQDSLNLGQKIDFHLRLFPVLPHRVGDPYGTAAIYGTQVAYVAALTDPASGPDRIDDDGEFEGFTATALKEIGALEALALGTFDGESFQPPSIAASYPTSDPFVNLDIKAGDVLGTTDRFYDNNTLLPNGVNRTYQEWFFREYFRLEDGTYRYQVIVFGSDVDVTLWANAPNVDANKELKDFVTAGGTLIFLGNPQHVPDFIVDCATADCALRTLGNGMPVTTPDSTNQIVSIPNKLDTAAYPKGAKWLVCDEGTHDERMGFLPVLLQTVEGQAGDTAGCHDLYLGMTTSERFGASGGAVIFSSFALGDASMTQADVARVLSNYLNYAMLRPLFLDYGREIPMDEPVSTATRLMTIEMPNGSSRDVKIVLYLWRRA